MKNTYLYPKMSVGRSNGHLVLLAIYMLLMVFPYVAKSQTKIVANQVVPTTDEERYKICYVPLLNTPYPCDLVSTIDDETNAATDNDTYARLHASPGLLLGLGGYKAGIELTFPQNIPADRWSFVRISADESLLRALLGGSLGNALGTVLGAVLLGNQEVEIEALHNGTSRLKRTNTQGFDTDRVRLVKDANNNFYIAIKPNGEYNKIKITNRSTSVAGLFTNYILDVYSAVSYTDDSQACGAPFFTSFDGGSGLGLQVADLNNQHLERAIDNDPDTYSQLKSSGTLNLSVARTLSQYFYFNTPSAMNHTFNIKLGFASSGVANLDLLGALQVIAWNGDQVVYTKSLSSGLLNGLNVLALFDNPQYAATLTFAPGKAFDRIEVRLNAVVGANLIGNGIYIYDVRRYSGETGCENPEISDPDVTPAMLSNKNCAVEVISAANADFVSNTVDGKNDTYAILQASSGIAAGLGAYSGHVEMGFGAAVQAQTTTYVRIDFDEGVLNQLLDGSVGDLLGETLDNVLLGGHYFVVEAKEDNTVVFSRSSNNGFDNSGSHAVGTGDIKIVQDKNGHYYVAVTANAAFSSIRITERLSALVGLRTVKSMHVYHACYPTGALACEQSFATYSESEGISLDLLGIGQAGVTNAEGAIDGDSNTGSKISVGAAGVGTGVLQHVQFHGLSTAQDHFRVKMRMSVQGTVSADIIGSVVIKAYNGDEEVYAQRLNEQLLPNLDLLTLLSNGSMINIPIAPGKAFDRIAVGISSLVSTNVLTSPLEVFSVERFSTTCPDPELSWEPKTDPPFNQKDCGTSVVDFEHVSFPLEAITDNPDYDTHATLSAGAGLAGGIGAYSSYLELKYTNPVAAHEVSYIRVDSESGLFGSLLGGSLGNVLGNLFGTVALDDQYIRITMKDGAGNPIGSPSSSQSGLNTERFRVVKDTEGRFYLAVTAAQPYQSVRVEYHHNALVGGMGSSSIKVYSMCRELQLDVCEQATFTSWDGSGIALDIADLTKGGVANPEFAIDNNNANYSTLNLGLAGVGTTVSQTIYFKSKSATDDSLRVRLQLREPGILNVDLLGQARLKLYNGENLVYNELLTAGTINNLDLLGLFNSGGVQSLIFFPNVVYDRAKLEITSIVGLNVSAPIHLYGMSRISQGCPDPDFMEPPYRAPVCADLVYTGLDGNNEPHTYAVDDISNAIDGDHNSYATIRSGAGVIFGMGAVNGKLTMGYQADVPAGTISYIRIAENSGLLDALLSGSLGDVVGGLVNGITLGNHRITVNVQNAAGANLPSATTRVVQDRAGRYYIALTANEAYRRVVIRTSTESVVGVTAQHNALHVYGMCYETNFEGCAEAVTTSWDGSGLALGATGIGTYGVRDAYRALDNNNNSDYATLSLGTLNVAGHIQQNIQFNKALEPNSLLRVQMSFDGGEINASVFGRMRLIAYEAGELVYNETIENAVLGNVNLSQLYDNGAIHEITFSPNVAFDEVALRLDALAGVSVVVPNLRLYYIKADCDVPVFKTWKSYSNVASGTAVPQVVGGEEIAYTIHVQNTGTVDLNGYIIEDTIPAHTTYVAGSADADDGVYANGEVSFADINVPVGTTKTVRFRVTVDADLTAVDKISNVAFVKADSNDPGVGTVPPADLTNPNVPHPSATPGTPTDIPVQTIKTVSAWKGYAIANGVSQTSVRGGEDVTYTLYIKNTGNQNLTGLTVSDNLPTGTTFQSATNGGTFANGVVSFEGIDLPFGQTTSVSFVVKVDTDLTGLNEIRNIAYVKQTPTDAGTPTAPADPTDPTAGPDPTSNPGDPTVIPVTDIFDLVLWKSYKVRTVGSSTFNPAIVAVSGGETVEYTVYVKNTGNKALTNAAIADPLTSGIVLVSGHSASHTFTTLAVGETKSYTFRVVVDKDLTGIDVIRNIATATSGEITTGKQSHPPLHNLNPTEPDIAKTGTEIDVTPIHDVSIELNGVSNGTNSGMAAQGDKITYTITVKNTGNKDLEDLTLMGDIPLGTAFETSVSGGTQNNNRVEFPVFDLAVGETKTFTYVIVTNSVNPPAPINNEAIVNFEDPQGANDSRNDTHSMPTSCTPVVAGDLELSASDPICLGEEVTLTAVLSGTSTLDLTALANVVWYSAYNSTTGVPSGELGTGASITVTPGTSGNVTYYAIVAGAEYCFQNPPAQVDITVNATPATPVISAITTDKYCEGEVVTLSVSNPQVGLTYSWFKDGAPLADGPSANIVATGRYAVQASNGSCVGDLSQGIDIVIYPRPTADDIQVSGHEAAVCAGTTVSLQAALVAVPSTVITNPVFHWYSDATLTTKIHTGSTLQITPSGTVTYYVTVSGDQVCENSASDAKAVVVTVSPTPDYTVTGDLTFGIEVGNSVTLPTIQSSTATVIWYDDAGNAIGGSAATRQFNEAGTYTYTAVIAQAGHCTVTVSVVINVFAVGECPPIYNRIYATDASSFGVSLLGTVTNANHAADGNLGSHSTLTEAVNILGLTGQTYQTLKWSTSVQAGIPVSVKLGKSLSTANVLGSLRLVAVNASGTGVSTVQDVEPKLVDVLGGLNVYEYTFTPVDQNGQPVTYSGVKVYFAGAVSVLQTAHVYEAYYHETGTVDCGADEVSDVLHGVENPISTLGVGNILVGVSDAGNAVDNDPATFAIMNNVAAVNAQTRLEVLYSMPALAGDTLLINLSSPGGLLSVQALQSFTIQPYLGNVPVGQPVAQDGVVLKIDILSGGTGALLTYTADQAFDRIKILYGGVANVLGQLYVHEISRRIPDFVTGDNNDNVFAICEGGNITITSPDDCVLYKIYDSETGRTEVDVTTLGVGSHTLYVQTIRFGTCEVGIRTAVEVIISEIPGTPHVADQILCQTAVASSIPFDATPLAGYDLIYYANVNTNTPLSNVPTANSSVVGTTTVYVSQRSGNNCESLRIPVRITINRTATAADITTGDITICQGQSVVLTASSATVTNPIFRFYTDAALTQEITNLSVSPSTNATYYVTVSGDAVCANLPGNAAAIQVIVNVTSAPTTDDITPTYCSGAGKTLADLPIIGTAITWYATPMGGVALPKTTLLQNGVTYYASQKGVGNCESLTRLAVTPVIRDCEVALRITKQADNSRVVAGENTSFTLTITNNGPEIVKVGDVIILEDIPSVGLEITGFGIDSHYGSISHTANSATITVNNIIPVNGTITVKVLARVDANPPATVSNKVLVWGPDTPPGDDPDDEDETPPIPVDREYDLTIVKVSDQGRVKAGESTSFTVTVTNNGPSAIAAGKNLLLGEQPSAGLRITGYSVTSGNATVSGSGNSATLTTSAALGVGGTIVVKITADVDADAPATVSNKVLVWGPDTPPGDDPDNEDETPPIPVDREHKLQITKVADEERVKAGETTTFTITITNTGPAVIDVGKVISMRERPGDGVTIDAYEMISNNATVVGSGNNVTLTTTTKIAVNGTIVLRIVATIDEDAPEFITNGITVWGPEKDPDDDPEDDKDDPDPIPVDHPLIEAHDDFVEVRLGSKVTIVVLLNDVVTKWDIDPTTVEITQQPAFGEVEVLPTGAIIFTAPKDRLGDIQFKYTVKDIKGRKSNEATVTVTVLENPLEIPNVITPNGDEFNDKFVIRGLELYERVHLTVMNRWGNEVYKNNAYDNDWTGRGLNEGTYFYILELMRDGKVTKYSGSILIKRN